MSFIGGETCTRVRYDADPDVDPATGLPTGGDAKTETQLVGTVDPMDQEELETLVEGDRNVEGVELITATELRTADETDDHPPDDVKLRGKVYEVRGVVYYPEIIPHYEAKLVRKV